MTFLWTCAALVAVIVPIVALNSGLTGEGKLLLWAWIVGLLPNLLLMLDGWDGGYFGNVPRLMLELYFLSSLLSLFLYVSMTRRRERRAEGHSTAESPSDPDQ